MKHGIVIVGGNGSGKTTLGRYLSEMLGYKHMDVEDYYFKNSDIPYANPRTRDEVQNLMLQDIKSHGDFIISSVNGDLGTHINGFYDLIVYIEVPLDVRMERVQQRSIDKFGARVLAGGDMYEQEQNFFDFVRNRTMEKTDIWVKTMKCPVVYIDGTKDIKTNAEYVAKLIAQ